ncbi:MAG: hypothetical protein KJ822_04060 [Proteobacteria bacterium]|nr:hypothetical protein [Pseudomonadota bacterium]MBU4354505.1 hypothetical protein [Pseudomonadota bacterium]
MFDGRLIQNLDFLLQVLVLCTVIIGLTNLYSGGYTRFHLFLRHNLG